MTCTLDLLFAVVAPLGCAGCFTNATLSRELSKEIELAGVFTDGRASASTTLVAEYHSESPDAWFAVRIPLAGDGTPTPPFASPTGDLTAGKILDGLTPKGQGSLVSAAGDRLTDADHAEIESRPSLTHSSGGSITAVFFRRFPDGRVESVPDAVTSRADAPLPPGTLVAVIPTRLPLPEYAVDRERRRVAELVPFTLALDALVDVPLIMVGTPIVLIATAVAMSQPQHDIHPIQVNDGNAP